MVVIRRRLIFWLIKAYIKKSGKTIIFSFLLGLGIFFAFLFISQYVTPLIPKIKSAPIGIVGTYTQDNLPAEIIQKLSQGLTSVAPDGSIKPQLASSWKITDHGKTYTFYLKPGSYFNDGKEVTSNLITYNFSDVNVEKPDKYTIVFKLKDDYAPFLATVSKPVFQKGYIGTGEYRIKNIKMNGNFVQTLNLVSAKNRLDTISYLFYPTEEALKMAFLLGEVSKASGVTTQDYKENRFDKFPNTKVEERADNTRLVTIFFNTQDSFLSDRKMRIALSYALPEEFNGGSRSFLPYPTDSVYYNRDGLERRQDLEHAKLLLDSSASGSATPTVNIKTLKRYRAASDAIAVIWNQLGVKTSIEEVDRVPDNFQIFLGDFNLPKDPDQYQLWHSSQRNNIMKYKNLRIDKLLEDGRKTVDPAERKKLYDDFQKYLTEDQPAVFLYFPIEYDITRK